MHARIRATRADSLHLAAEEKRKRMLNLALHGELAGLAGEPAERRAVVGDGE